MAHNVARHPAGRAQQRLALAVATLLGGTAAHGASGNETAPGTPRAAIIASSPHAFAAALTATADERHAPSLTSAPLAVTSCADDGDFDTLRHAVVTANPGDTIDLSALTCSKITLASSIPVNFAPLTIVGPGAANLTIDGNYADRVFVNNTTSTLTLQDLTVAHGTYSNPSSPNGGCVYSKGSVTLQRVVVNACVADGQFAAKGGGVFTNQDLQSDGGTFSNNSAVAHVGGGASLTAGGAMYVGGMLTMNDSIVSGNSVTTPNGRAFGGAAMATQVQAKYSTFTNNEAHSGSGGADGGALRSATSTVIVGSTLDHNKADTGGAVSIIGASGSAGILQSTLSSNTANTGLGEAIVSNVDIEIDNSTIAFNDGGVNSTGVWIANGSVTLKSTIIADNAALDIDVFNPTQLGGDSNLVKLAGNGAKLPAGTVQLDPVLGPLAYNGGLVRTHAIDAMSPAIDVGSNAAKLDSDQRGAPYARKTDGAVDIGAFEFDADHVFGCRFELH